MGSRFAIASSTNRTLKGKTLRQVAVELGFLNGEEFDRIVRPEKMLGPEE